MSKKVVVISASYRKGGNSDTLAQEFMKGASDAGNEVTKINLAEKKINYCLGCLLCQETKECVIHDDMKELLKTMKAANVIAFATPIYYYEMSGQMKTFLDRTNPLFTDEYQFRDIYLLASAADTESATTDGAVKGLNGWITCYEKTRLAGVVFAGGVNEKGEVKAHADVLQKAYEMGRDA